MTTWNEIFAPVLALGREPREGQTLLGNAIIEAIENRTSLVGEAQTGTGKSFAALVPIIDKVVSMKSAGKIFRGVISTETITLQTQLIEKDLPFLSTLYGNFTYRKLLGRSNYVCFNSAKIACRGNITMYEIYEKLYKYRGNMVEGELADVEKVLGYEVTSDIWSFMSGSADFCGDNQCDATECYSSRARALAKSADIVIANHALLAVHTEMVMGDPESDGILGSIDVLVVDEGHQLEPVLVSQWTKSISDWELHVMAGSVTTGLEMGKSVYKHGMSAVAQDTLDNIQVSITGIMDFFVRYGHYYKQKWAGSESALCLKTISPGAPTGLLTSMAFYEDKIPDILLNAVEDLKDIDKAFVKIKEAQAEKKAKGVTRKINKGHRAVKDLIEAISILGQAIPTKDGIVQNYGYYGALVDGWERKNGEKGMTLRFVPLDVSPKAANIWKIVDTPILISATLADLTDGSFTYAKACIAFPPGAELKVATPFDLKAQQLIYVSPAQLPKVEDVQGAQFSFDELVYLLIASRGRSLVLFTSRAELDWTAQKLKAYAKKSGKLPYNIYVQERECNKSKLMESFKNDTHSILLATKSFFVGVDVPGESLSSVILCKYPLPRYSAECRQQIAHWRNRGFYNWYQRESLTTFQQAAGRLIRSSGCKGVVALLDQRAFPVGEKVHVTAMIGIEATNSNYTFDIKKVEEFLG